MSRRAGYVSLKGKIARLPVALRHEVSRRLWDGETGPQLLSWLNALPETEKSLRPIFGDTWRVSSQNLSAWRLGGYREWLKGRRIVEIAQHLITLMRVK